jgi:catechol 2,3-dioxygenase-like lactoylglutathione lyase family enzyme
MKAVTCLTAAATGLIGLLAAGPPAGAQLIAAKINTVAMGHHHLLAKDVEASARFWLSLGGERTSLGSNTVIKFPNVLVFLREGEPSGGSAGTVVDHIGLQFRELRSLVKRMRADGVPVITEEVVGGTFEVDEDGLAFNDGADAYLAFVSAPSGAKVELYENTKLDSAVANHHIHFYTNEVDTMKAWYVTNLGAAPGQRSGMEAADVGGVNLTFSPSDSRRAGTKGRSLDHIGFEVDGLEALCRKLEADGIAFDRPYEKIESLGVAVAFFTDPWGTYVELTEGLDEL